MAVNTAPAHGKIPKQLSGDEKKTVGSFGYFVVAVSFASIRFETRKRERKRVPM